MRHRAPQELHPSGRPIRRFETTHPVRKSFRTTVSATICYANIAPIDMCGAVKSWHDEKGCKLFPARRRWWLCADCDCLVACHRPYGYDAVAAVRSRSLFVVMKVLNGVAQRLSSNTQMPDRFPQRLSTCGSALRFSGPEGQHIPSRWCEPPAGSGS